MTKYYYSVEKAKNKASIQIPVTDEIIKIPKSIIALWFFFACYLVLPLVDVPLLGLSLSAPIFFFVALYCIFKPPQPWPPAIQKWILLAVLIWSGIFISTLFNGILRSGSGMDTEAWTLLVQNAYWLLTFVITSYFASRANILERTAKLLSWAVFALALVRLFEAVVWGAVNTYESVTRLLTPNTYGFLFSTFFPFLLVPLFAVKGGNKFLPITRVLIVAVAVAINGSRSSWISVAAGTIFFTLLIFFLRSRKVGMALFLLSTLVVSILLGLNLLPEPVQSAISLRASTFQNLEQDKSYVFRELMLQKGLKLFEESPIIGVGASRFRKESVELELSGVFKLYSQSSFDRKSAHNSYVGFLAESGLIGSLPLLVLILMLAFKGLKAAISHARREDLWALSVMASFVGMSIHMWTISALAGTVTWFAYGLVAALIVLEQHFQETMQGQK